MQRNADRFGDGGKGFDRRIAFAAFDIGNHSLMQSAHGGDIFLLVPMFRPIFPKVLRKRDQFFRRDFRLRVLVLFFGSDNVDHPGALRLVEHRT
jgi:hypothetical protein